MLDFWLQSFICEIRRKTHYPPIHSLKQLRQFRGICEINVKNQIHELAFFKEDGHVFAGFKRALDGRMKDGVGENKKRSDPVTQEDEDTFRDTAF